jgi:Na+/H+ antiporter NhaD/arsenite permease-like protein
MSGEAIGAAIVFALVYLFIIRGKPNPTVVVLIGAALVVLVGFIDSEDALHHIDMNVILLLAAMMIVADIMARTGVFDWIATKGIRLMKGSGFGVMALLAVVTAVVSAFIDNVTTVVIMLPVTIALCKTLELNPIPFFISEVFASNIGGTATIIGDPPNIIVASAADIPFVTFMLNVAPVSIMCMFVLIGLMWVLFRKDARVTDDKRKALMDAPQEELIKDKQLLLRVGIVFCLTILGFLLHNVVHVEVAFIAMAGAAVMVLVSRMDVRQVLHGVEWTTLGFFVGLFILVGTLTETGVIGEIKDIMVAVSGGEEAVARGESGPLAMLLVWGGGAASGIIDNIPYTAAMAEVVKQIPSAAEGVINPLWWALILGADLGGNATMIGASANVYVVNAARSKGYHISFWHFFKYGLFCVIGTLAVSAVWVWLRYYL